MVLKKVYSTGPSVNQKRLRQDKTQGEIFDACLISMTRISDLKSLKVVVNTRFLLLDIFLELRHRH
jgi:hypothetical protein